jgi:hypothetical protein
MTSGILKPNKVRPKKRKNNIVHQAAIEFGILMSFSFEHSFEAPRACYLAKHTPDNHVTHGVDYP